MGCHFSWCEFVNVVPVSVALALLTAFAYDWFKAYRKERSARKKYIELASIEGQFDWYSYYRNDNDTNTLLDVNYSKESGFNKLVYKGEGRFDITYYFSIDPNKKHTGRLLMMDEIRGEMDFEQDFLLNGVRPIFWRQVTNSKGQLQHFLISYTQAGTLCDVYSKMKPEEFADWMKDYGPQKGTS